MDIPHEGEPYIASSSVSARITVQQVYFYLAGHPWITLVDYYAADGTMQPTCV